MSDAFFTVKEVSTRFIDPVVEQLMYSLMNKFGLRDYFNNGYYVFNGRTAVSKSDDTQGNMRMGNNRCDVTVETHMNPSVQMWDRLVDYNVPAYGTSKLWTDRYEKLWEDRDVGVNLIEFTVPFGVTMNVVLTFKSYDAAQTALDRITTLASGDVANDVHDITYSYPIELPLIGLWGRVYDARKSLNQSLTFYQYVQKFMLAQMAVNVNKYDVTRATQDTEYVFKKYQLSCLAILQCDQESPEPAMQDDVADAWTVSFSYKFQSGRPQTIKMSYPPVVEQTVLPNIMFAKPNPGWFERIAGSFQNATFTRAFRNFVDIANDTKVIFRFPKYDDWNPPYNTLQDRYKFDQIMIGIVCADTNRQGSMSFNDLGPVTLHPMVLTLMGQHTQDDILSMTGLFNITVYVDDIQLDNSLVSFDPTTLTVSFLADRPTGIYRVMLSEAADIRTIDPKWQDTILQYRYFFPMTIFRNLNYLVSMGRYCVRGDNALINLIKRLNQTDKLSYYLEKMVSGGYTDGTIYHYTQTSTQFADYITDTRAHMDRDTTSDADYVKDTLFDVLMSMLIADGFISAAQKPREYLRLPNGYPYGAGAGGWVSFNTPLRIQQTVFETN